MERGKGKPPLVHLVDAVEDARAISRWYELRSERACGQFRESLAAAVEKVLAYPASGKRGPCGTRSILLHRFPYRVVYRSYSNLIMVVAIAHTSRRPGYWRSRVASE
ncbi:MAG: type II toxin-antitoxin system RelE/ParE family toxin [Phycisphaerae bacterium]